MTGLVVVIWLLRLETRRAFSACRMLILSYKALI